MNKNESEAKQIIAEPLATTEQPDDYKHETTARK